jgi:hypothetical protein
MSIIIISYFFRGSQKPPAFAQGFGAAGESTRMDGNEEECPICVIRDIRGSPDSSCLLVYIRGLTILIRELRTEVLKNL